MKKRFNKSWGIVFLLAMIFSLLPISAFATEHYGIYVAGIEITSDNKDDESRPGVGSGTVKYDPDTKTLTLDSAGIDIRDIEVDGRTYSVGIYSTVDDLKIHCIGNNQVNNTSGTVKTNDSIGIWAKNLKIFGKASGATELTAGNTSNGKSIGLLIEEDLYIFRDRMITQGGSATGDSLGIDVKGKFSMEGIYLHASGETRAIQTGSVGHIEPLFSVKRSESLVGQNDPMDVGDHNDDLYSPNSPYKTVNLSHLGRLDDLWVNGTRVTGNNKDDVFLDGSVKVVYNFANPTVNHTLILTNATINADDLAIESGENLNIELHGDNTIKVRNSGGRNLTGIQLRDRATGDLKDLVLLGDGSLTVEVESVEGVESKAIISKTYTQDGSATLYAKAGTKVLDVENVAVGITNPSIIASENANLYPVVKVTPANVETLKNDTPVYKAVKITPSDKLTDGLTVDGEGIPNEAEVKVKEKDSLGNFGQSIHPLEEDDIVTVKVEVKNDKKELDKIVIERDTTDILGNTEIVATGSNFEFDFVMLKGDVNVKAILKDKAPSGSSGSGGSTGAGGGGGSSNSTVRPPTQGSAKPDDKSSQTDKQSQTTKNGNYSVLKVGSNSYTVVENGVSRQKTTDVAIRVHKGRTVLPARMIAELLEVEVKYDVSTKTATFTYNGNSATLKLGQKYMTVNGEKVALTSDILNVQGRILLPLTDIQKAFAKLGLKSSIEWNQSAKTVTVSK